MTSIVFCEDDPVIQRLIQVATRSLTGYHVHIVSDGAAGLAAIERERASIVFTDLSMPGMNGHQLLEALRGRPDLGDVHVVVVTAAALQAQEMDDLRAKGASDFLAKPFGPAELRARLDRLAARLSD